MLASVYRSIVNSCPCLQIEEDNLTPNLTPELHESDWDGSSSPKKPDQAPNDQKSETELRENYFIEKTVLSLEKPIDDWECVQKKE